MKMTVVAKNGRSICIGFIATRMVDVPNGTCVLVTKITGDEVYAHLPHPTGDFYADVVVMQKEDFPGIH